MAGAETPERQADPLAPLSGARALRRTLATMRLRTRRRRRRALARARLALARTRHHVLVLGDSHAQVFRQPILGRLPVRFEVESISGATLSGLENPNSQTQAGPIYARRLAQARRRPPRAVVIMLGEVDCGFVIWWNHEQRGVPLATGVERAVGHLVAFVGRAGEVAPVVVISAPLPTLRDGVEYGEYEKGFRKQVHASQVERTRLVIEFNRLAREAVEAAGATFVDLDGITLGPDGLVSPILLHPFEGEHHYDPPIYARLLERRLRRLREFRPELDR
jgi:hypothetical protein